jgi:hypothetical protein
MQPFDAIAVGQGDLEDRRLLAQQPQHVWLREAR